MRGRIIGARLTSDELKRLDRLAKRAGLSRSAALRALVGAADTIEPQPARVSFKDNGAAVSEAHGAVVPASHRRQRKSPMQQHRAAAATGVGGADL